jgi:hypothetical protein
LIDAAAKDSAGVRGDAFTVTCIRDRILGTLDSADLGRINTQLLALQIAGFDEDFAAAADAAAQLRKIISRLQP